MKAAAFPKFVAYPISTGSSMFNTFSWWTRNAACHWQWAALRAQVSRCHKVWPWQNRDPSTGTGIFPSPSSWSPFHRPSRRFLYSLFFFLSPSLFLTYTSSLSSEFEMDGYFYTSESPNQKDDFPTLRVRVNVTTIDACIWYCIISTLAYRLHHRLSIVVRVVACIWRSTQQPSFRC